MGHAAYSVPSDLVTVAEAARQVGVGYETIRKHVKRWRLFSARQGKYRMVSLSEVLRHFEEWGALEIDEYPDDDDGEE